ncbi:hypothetical protein QBC36DRAFT_384544 [Triangularia setosa]|uniref:Uncharacterized protein n=1 Tax=Triangularia setosa TaxID=2587417 RepID=A0AAN6WET5_9PEZI|nr:hypothetical protein QBC36DRAFT_384544 [Podospora setosa]
MADSTSSDSLSRPISSGSFSSSNVIRQETSTPLSNTSHALHSPAPSETLNLRHVHLIVHLTSSKDIFDFGATPHRPSENSAALTLALQKGLEAPYLLYQLLAISSSHFAILGHHLLADALSLRSRPLDVFLAEYARCSGLHRGVRTIAASSWPMLMESELIDMLSWKMIDISASLKRGEKEACHEAIKFLQVGFDSEHEGEAGSKGNKHQMTYSWPVVVPPELVALLTGKRPEALVVLGYICVLLHHARQMWQIRDAGRYIFAKVDERLGEDWRCWLDWPLEMIAID